MEPNKLSRRHWLGRTLAAFAGLLGISNSGPAAPAAPPAAQALPPEGVVVVNTYDADGHFISTRQERGPWPRQVVVCDASGRVVSTTDLI